MNTTDNNTPREPHFNQLQTLKRRFFAMRNGLITDTLRRAGSKFRIIFGLNIPQLVEIAADYGHDPQLAETLWANTSTRESCLLAPMLWQPSDLTLDRLIEMSREINDIELADHFCHRLIRRHPDALTLAATLYNSPLDPDIDSNRDRDPDPDPDLDRYIALRIYLNHLVALPLDATPGISFAELKAIADAEIALDHPITLPLAHRILDELSFRE